MSYYSGGGGGAAASDVMPLPAAQVGKAGVASDVAREDHVHEGLVPVDLTFGADGRYTIPGYDFQGQQSVAFPVGALVYMLIYVPITVTYDRIGIQVNTAVTASNARLGIYHPHSSGGRPGALLLDAGVVSTATTGLKEIEIAQEVTPGFHFLAMVRDAEAAVRLRGIDTANEVYGTLVASKATSMWGSPLAVQATVGCAGYVAAGLPDPAPSAMDGQLSHEGICVWLRGPE